MAQGRRLRLNNIDDWPHERRPRGKDLVGRSAFEFSWG
jgi:hypothetical protein